MINTLLPLKEIKFEVTHDCLLNCVHCSSNSIAVSDKTMDWVRFNRVLNEAKDLGLNKVAFSGGEPLLWSHIEDATSASINLGINTILYTTGNAPNAEVIIKKLHDVGLNQVVFSVYSANSNEHEKVTNYKGSFDQTVEIAKYCSNIGLNTEFHFVPLSWNYKLLPEVINLASRIGVNRTSILRLVPQGRAKDIRGGQLNHSQNVELREMILKLRNDGNDIRLGSPYNFLMLSKNSQCQCGIDRMTIGPDFRIFPCDAFKHIIPEDIGESSDYSNLKNHSLKECWEGSTYFQSIRNYLMSGFATECMTCSKLQECKSGCLAQKFYAYGTLLKAPDPMCLFRKQINRDR